MPGACWSLGYGCLRLRTPWLGPLAAGDGLVAVGAALLATLAERRLRPPEPEPQPGTAALAPPDPRLPPDDFPEPPAPGEREMGWLAAALAAASVIPLFDERGAHPLGRGRARCWRRCCCLCALARHGPLHALAAAILFNTTIVVALTRLQIASYAAYALPIGGSIAVLVQVYRDRLGFDAAARAVPPLAVGGVCALQVFQTPALLPAALLGAVGLLMLPAVAIAGANEVTCGSASACLAAGRGGAGLVRPRADTSASDVLVRLPRRMACGCLPAMSLLFALAARGAAARAAIAGSNSPLEILHARVRDGLALAAVTAAGGADPVAGARTHRRGAGAGQRGGDRALALRLAPRLPAGWPVMLAGAGAVGAYAYLRLRSGWMDGWQRWDGLMAVAGGLALVLVERLLRRANPPSDERRPRRREEDPGPLAVRGAEVRILATAITCLSAVAFLHRRRRPTRWPPRWRCCSSCCACARGHPIHGVLAVLYLNATWRCSCGTGT